MCMPSAEFGIMVRLSFFSYLTVTEPVGGTSHPNSTASVSVGFVNSVTEHWEGLSATELDKKAVHELVRTVRGDLNGKS